MNDSVKAQTAETAGPIAVPEELANKSLGQDELASEAIPADAAAPTLPDLPGGLDEFVRHTHGYTREYIALADQKAAFLFTICTAMLVYMYREGALEQWLYDPRRWGFWAGVAFVATAALFVAAGSSVATVWPRLRGASRGIVFWKAIAGHKSSTEYVSALESMTARSLTTEMAAHLYELAAVCKRKYRWLSFAIWSAGLGMALATLVIVAGVI